MSTASPRRLLVAVLGIPVFVALALAAFAWPVANLAPRSLPLGLAGPAVATARLAAALEARQPGAFSIECFAGETQARQAIQDRSVYGALVLAPTGNTLLVASAGSPLVAQLLTQALAAPAHGQSMAIDVVPAAPNDPRGLGFGSSLLPLVLVGVITAVLLSVLSGPGLAQIAAFLAAALLAGLSADAVAQGWLGLLQGEWPANAGVLALTVLAIAATIGGLRALAGYAGLGVGVLLMVFVGNPFSAVTTAPELLPSPVGAIGQLLPPGAGGNLLRSTAFFGGGGAGSHVLVLAAWAVSGLAALALGAYRASSRSKEAARR
jgi:hypothetical protein